MNPHPPQPIAAILAGPTASGKSALAIAIAARHGLAIISADSMQVYRGMEIGTGVPTPAERGAVPHHLLSIADPREDFHAARFVAEARAAAEREWSEHGRRSLVVGGTGMWIQALREGLFEGPGRDEGLRAALRAQLEAEGPAALHAALAVVDPAMAARLAPADHVRVLRALEVYRLTGRPLSDWHAEDARRRAALGPLLPLVVLTPPRDWLDARINARVDSMIAAGWLEEARALHQLALPPHSPARKALGYRTLFEVIEGRLSRAAAVEQIKLATRQFARRQGTWFRGQRAVVAVETPDLIGVEKALLAQVSKGI
jgi:tRNA dimethylallyltransferase